MALVDVDADEAWLLFGRAAVARVALVRGGLPVIYPVNVCTADGAVWFRVEPGALLDAALLNDVVTVEADDVDGMEHAGWSVLVTGRAEVAADRADLPLRPWGRPGAHHLVRVPAEVVTGRRVEAV